MDGLGNASKIERWAIGIVFAVLMFSFGMVVFSVTGFGLDVANCLTAMAPFKKGEVIQHDPNHFEVHVVARMWSFDPVEIVVPPKAQVDIYLTSADVTHGFIVPGTNVNMMAVPGAVNFLRTKFDEEGVYTIACHEYCGTGHQEMGAAIRVEPFGKIEERRKREQQMPLGLRVMQSKGCIACHTFDGTPSTGPTFKGLYGKDEELADGSKAPVNEQYVRESVLEPKAKVVSGYQPVMPAFQLSEHELLAVTDYIKKLK